MKIGAYVHLSRTLHQTTGVGKHSVNMIRGMAAAGHEVRVLTTQADLINGQIIGRESQLCGMEATPLPWRRVMMERSWLLFDRPKVDRWTPKLDWVYAPGEVYVASRPARLAGTIHCVNWLEPELPWYNDPETRRLRRRIAPKWKAILNRSAVVLTVSEFLKQRIIKLFGTPEDRLVIVGNGVEEAYFQMAGEAAVADGRPYLLVVGALTQRKGAEYVLAVARALASKQSDIEIRLVGTSEERYLPEARSLGNVVEMGMLGLDRLPKLVRNSVAVLFLSRYETFGIPALEAMAAGVPAIVSNFAGLPETVGNAGLVFDPTKTEQIVACCEELMRHSNLREEFIHKGLKRAQEYRWEKCVGLALRAMEAQV